jgi:hypothetical protein
MRIEKLNERAGEVCINERTEKLNETIEKFKK